MRPKIPIRLTRERGGGMWESALVNVWEVVFRETLMLEI
jgi:hypothetical protein